MAAAVMAACFAGLLLLISCLIRQSDAYQVAVHRATTAPAVIGQLGEPIQEGWFLSGDVELTNDDGVANLEDA